jgi:hypothetical protein
MAFGVVLCIAIIVGFSGLWFWVGIQYSKRTGRVALEGCVEDDDREG